MWHRHERADAFAARVLQGAGAAFLVTGALALVASAFPGAGQRARAFGVMGVISGVAMALGPTLGSFLASWFGWRWIFLANIPFCVALALAVPRLVAETRDPEGPAAGPCRRRVAYDVAWPGDRCASEARRLPRHESRLPGGKRHGSDTFWLAPTAESASTARSPCIRNAGHGRSRRVADRHPVRLLGHAGLPAAVS